MVRNKAYHILLYLLHSLEVVLSSTRESVYSGFDSLSVRVTVLGDLMVYFKEVSSIDGGHSES